MSDREASEILTGKELKDAARQLGQDIDRLNRQDASRAVAGQPGRESARKGKGKDRGKRK